MIHEHVYIRWPQMSLQLYTIGAHALESSYAATTQIFFFFLFFYCLQIGLTKNSHLLW